MTTSTSKARGGKRVPGPGKKLGRPPNPDKKQRFPVKLPPEVIAWLRTRKQADPGFSMGGWIGATLRDAIHDRRPEFVAVCAMERTNPGYIALYGLEAESQAAANIEGGRVAAAFGQRLLIVARWRQWPGAMGRAKVYDW